MKNKWIEAIVCFLPLTLVFTCEPFFAFFEREKKRKKKIVAYMCKCQIRHPQKSILGLILIRIKRCKKS
jgi:hypothetical protein